MTARPEAAAGTPAATEEVAPAHAAALALARALSLEVALGAGGLRSVFQPIVDLDTGAVVAFEALARGPVGPLERPDELFGEARAAGRLAELDAACRLSAFRAAVAHRLHAPLTVFVNVEPEVLDTAPLDDLLTVTAEAAGQLRVVLEITERSLAARPAHLLATVDRVRALGWGVALDDVGADSASLAFMPLLRPDVVKLDLRLVQDRPGPAVARIMNAVNAHAERTGAVVLAEGIETERHVMLARALGARLGQGWFFGRPQEVPAVDRPFAALALPPPPAPMATSPFGALPPGTPLRTSPKPLLVALSKQLEREALSVGETAVVAATFQDARFFTASTAQRYRALAGGTGFVAALGEGMADAPVPGVRGAGLEASDPVRGEWDVAVLGPHFAAALLARDLGDPGPDSERRFAYALTYDRDVVTAAARALLARVVPPLPVGGTAVDASAPARVLVPGPADPLTAGPAAVDPGAVHPPASIAGAQDGLRQVLAASSTALALCDAGSPGHPVVWVNAAHAALTGTPASRALGRSAWADAAPDADPAAVDRLRAALREGRSAAQTVLATDRSGRPWWDEVVVVPLTGADGRPGHHLLVHRDVTARVAAERAGERERGRRRAHREPADHSQRRDPETGLLSRHSLREALELALWDARATGRALGLLVVDVDGPAGQGLGASDGHAALVALTLAQRLRRQVRGGDVVARTGASRFVLALPGLDPASALADAAQVAAAVRAAVAQPVIVPGGTVQVRVHTGVALHPADGDDGDGLIEAAVGRSRAPDHPS